MSENYVGKKISDKLNNQRKHAMYVLLIINGSIICDLDIALTNTQILVNIMC